MKYAVTGSQMKQIDKDTIDLSLIHIFKGCGVRVPGEVSL